MMLVEGLPIILVICCSILLCLSCYLKAEKTIVCRRLQKGGSGGRGAVEDIFVTNSFVFERVAIFVVGRPWMLSVDAVRM